MCAHCPPYVSEHTRALSRAGVVGALGLHADLGVGAAGAASGGAGVGEDTPWGVPHALPLGVVRAATPGYSVVAPASGGAWPDARADLGMGGLGDVLDDDERDLYEHAGDGVGNSLEVML